MSKVHYIKGCPTCLIILVRQSIVEGHTLNNHMCLIVSVRIGGQRLKCQGGVQIFFGYYIQNQFTKYGSRKIWWGVNKLIVFITKFLAFEVGGEGYFCFPGGVNPP